MQKGGGMGETRGREKGSYFGGGRGLIFGAGKRKPIDLRGKESFSPPGSEIIQRILKGQTNHQPRSREHQIVRKGANHAKFELKGLKKGGRTLESGWRRRVPNP